MIWGVWPQQCFIFSDQALKPAAKLVQCTSLHGPSIVFQVKGWWLSLLCSIYTCTPVLWLFSDEPGSAGSHLIFVLRQSLDSYPEHLLDRPKLIISPLTQSNQVFFVLVHSRSVYTEQLFPQPTVVTIVAPTGCGNDCLVYILRHSPCVYTWTLPIKTGQNTSAVKVCWLPRP